MQVSTRFIAEQVVPSWVYVRLREALLQQRDLFDSVITGFPVRLSHNQASSAPTAVPNITAESGAGGEVDFVLMRSPSLSVLFVGHFAATNSTEAPTTPAEPDISHQESTQDFRECRVQLTFDESTISTLLSQIGLQVNHANAHGANMNSSNLGGPTSNDDPSLGGGTHAHVRSSDAAPAAAKRLLAQLPEQAVEESFALNWSKQLAIAPDGSSQASLNNQIEQSLLLNQVINRIRHSLDLSAILETTVAQVRDFLSADRLVLYQFERIEPPTPTQEAINNIAHRQSTSDDRRVNADSRPIDTESIDAELNRSTLYIPSSSNDQVFVGQYTHSGHVTYESRRSPDISSVLMLSEEECFKPSRSVRDRYTTGKPIAVDDVDQHYSHASCLLNFLKEANVKSKLIAPILVHGQLWGLVIAHQCQYRHWEETEVVFLQHIAEHLAVAIEQASLYQRLREQTVNLESCVIERTQNLRDALMAAESANLTKGEFLSTMSHELRTPLTYIIGMSATLLRWSFGDLTERQRSYLTTINSSGEQLLEIINDILEFAKVESGRSRLDFSEFSLTALIDSLMPSYRAIADKQEVDFSVDFQLNSQDDLFCADIDRLKQIITNLVHNAIKFTPAGGQVRLRVWKETQMTVFQVEDSGIGIPESQQDQLFEKFKQLESPFRRQHSGTGLGLAMTKHLVELHGGSIQVESAVGKGSTFLVQLPTKPPIPTRYEVPTAALESSKARVLLLEPAESNAAIVCDLLTADGYEVIWLVNADQLITQLDQLQPALLIASPDLLSSDREQVQSLQLSITAANTKFIALLDQQDALPSQVAHHDTLQKPIDPKRLLEKVRRLTDIAE